MSSYGQVYAAAIASVMESAVLQNAATGNGNGTDMSVEGYSTAVLSITASVAMSGGTTVNFEGSIDDISWSPLLGTNVGTTITATSTTAPGDWTFSIAGYKKLRARVSSYSAGTITVKGVTSPLSSSSAGGGGGASGNVNINQIAGNTPAVNNGAANNGTLRVTLASDGSGVVAATQSGTWNINNVSGTVSLPTGAATAAKQPTLGTAGSPSTDVISVQGIVSMTALKVDGSAATQPISAITLPLPSGAATAAKQPALGTAGSASSDVLTVQGIASMTALKIDGSAVTQPISASSLPLPTGAATAAKQPALGTAGSASSDVLTVQGIASMTALKIDGSAVTQPISASTLPLPTGAATAAKQPALGTAGSASSDVLTVQGIASMTALRVDGSAVTQPIAASSLPLPTGAATSAKQPAIGTAGSASADVISVQGIASMTPLKIDGSGSTQPISGSVTANAGTNLNTSALALESGGNLAIIAGAISSAKVQSNFAQIGGVAVATGNGAASTGVQRVTICNDSTGQIALTASKNSSATAMQTSATSNGNGTAMTVTGYAQAALSITGTVSGGTIINFEASADGSTFVSILGTNVSSGTTSTSTTATGLWLFPVAGFAQIRARISSWASPSSVTVAGYASVLSSALGGSGSGGGDIANITTSVTPGTAAGNLGKAEDAAHNSGDTGVFVLGVRSDTNNAATSVDGDYSQISTNKAGSIKAQIEPTLKATYSATCDFQTLANSTTDIFYLSGSTSSTKLVKVLKVCLMWFSLVSAGGYVYLQKRKDSVGHTQSAGSTADVTPFDSKNPTSTVHAWYYTANPTQQSDVVGNLAILNLAQTVSGNIDDGTFVLFDANVVGQPIVLRGTQEGIAINCGGTKPAGTSQKYTVTIFYTEEDTNDQ